ncbi:hypothetical protein MVLG_04057 [Microbotryum lychnidis-dioicae p1A1 Lamole]|uniref:Uncharacterized protein n=1 Tax=Microbotryum lychnidis-dioicae (strain p1A1 Lamole / MvSl-1064) TaxID=683840 RepID=U5HA22_USTV1|nr:hypothetical protein MVLG_04057 [Microbotryum lychnidis-dioicae p1A1 Lamole]|eukprot:KDE05562.1 hypothetical protein MVLG_04057 [Microbotryum lychnidis-dioicae p1A1 Lamole]
MTAVTGFHSSGSTLCQMLGSALVPGNARASLYFGLYSSNSVAQGSLMVKDLKLGQYTKVPPRALFALQAVGTLLGSVLNLVVMNSIVSSQREVLLDVEGTNLWSGYVQSYNTQAIAQGDGLLVPLPFYIGHHFWPNLCLNQIVTPEMCRCLGYLSVGINSSVFVSFLLAIYAQFYLRRKRSTFFRKYNYLMAAALDGGTDFMIFISTFTINGGAGKQYLFPNWALNPKGHYDYCVPLPKFE